MYKTRIIKMGQGYALGFLVMLFGMLATATIYVMGNGLIDRVTGVDLEKAVFWYRSTFLWVGVIISCVISTLAVADFLGHNKSMLWSWPVTVFLSSGFVEFLMTDHSYAIAVARVVGPVVMLSVTLVTVVIVWFKSNSSKAYDADMKTQS